MLRRIGLGVCCLAAMGVVTAWAEEPVDLEMVNKIRYEGFHRSQVMDTLEHLSDTIGPRLTNSPAMLEANEWTRDRMAEWGLKNAAIEPWGEFGRGWTYSHVSVDMLEPRATSLYAIPMAWTPGTDGPIEGEVMRVNITEEEDFEKYEGKLEGKILLVSKSRELPDDVTTPDSNERMLTRYTQDVIPSEDSRGSRKRYRKRYEFRQKLREFLAEEGAAATIRMSRYDYGVIEVSGDSSYGKGELTLPPSVYMASNHYNQLMRLVKGKTTVRLRIDIEAEYHEDNLTSYNTVAEIPGRGPKKDELVLLGGHLDSWHAATGAADNAGSCSVVMEAMRILQAIGAKPRRTIRAVLWSGEEQAMFGSRAYVEKHFATRPRSEDAEELKLPERNRERIWPITPLKDHGKFSVYFNLDNGGGKIRGIFVEDNAAVVPIFEAWLKPFEDLGATDVLTRHTSNTDHRAFDDVGLPGFQFVQDMRDYLTRTHHTNLDDVDHVRREDLIQASVILASFVYHAAMRDDPMPRKPMPQKPPERDNEEEEDDE